MGRKKGVSAAQSDQTATVSGTGAIRLTNQWWRKQCKRGPSADYSWKVYYQDALSPLMGIEDLRPEHLVALVETSEAASRTR